MYSVSVQHGQRLHIGQHVGAEQQPSQCAECVPGTRLDNTFIWLRLRRDIIRRPTFSTTLSDLALRIWYRGWIRLDGLQD
jgi:hypothetical protein